MKEDWNTGEGSLGERRVDGLIVEASDWADLCLQSLLIRKQLLLKRRPSTTRYTQNDVFGGYQLVSILNQGSAWAHEQSGKVAELEALHRPNDRDSSHQG